MSQIEIPEGTMVYFLLSKWTKKSTTSPETKIGYGKATKYDRFHIIVREYPEPDGDNADNQPLNNLIPKKGVFFTRAEAIAAWKNFIENEIVNIEKEFK